MSILDGEEFGAYLTRHREALGLTQNDLASELGVSQAAVGQWERGETFPRTAKLPAIASALRVPHAELVTLRHAAIKKLLPNVRVPESGVAEAELSQSSARSAAKSSAISGMGLLAQVASALDKGLLQAHQIAMLGSLIQTFQRDNIVLHVAAHED